MATKLPKPKTNKSAQEEEDKIPVIENDVNENETEQENVPADEQSAALENIMSSATQNAADAASDDEDDKNDEGNDESVPAVNEHSEENDDAGENPETAPPAENDGIVVTQPPKTVTRATTVKVATICDHSCHIGGVPYHFKKGVPTSVPEPVKKILLNAGLLMAL